MPTDSNHLSNSCRVSNPSKAGTEIRLKSKRLGESPIAGFAEDESVRTELRSGIVVNVESNPILGGDRKLYRYFELIVLPYLTWRFPVSAELLRFMMATDRFKLKTNIANRQMAILVADRR